MEKNVLVIKYVFNYFLQRLLSCYAKYLATTFREMHANTHVVIHAECSNC